MFHRRRFPRRRLGPGVLCGGFPDFSQRWGVFMRIKIGLDKRRILQWAKRSTMLWIVVAMMVLSILTVRNFATPYNLRNFALQVCDLLIISMGVTFTVLNGGLDFSSTSVLALSSVIGAYIMALSPIHGSGLSIFLAIVVMVILGSIVGVINGFAVVKLKMPSFIATLSTQLVFSGLAVLSASRVTSTASIIGIPPVFYMLGGVGSIWPPIVIAAGVFAFTDWLLSKTYFGRSVIMVGTNPKASYISGINFKRVIFILFLLSGAYAGIQSIILTARNQSGLASLGDRMYIDIMASIIIGGTSIFGGYGGAKNTLYGVLFVVLISNVMNLLGLDWYVTFTVKGLLIVVAALVDVFTSMRRNSQHVVKKIKKTGGFAV
jgi:ribose/xylose/arabinose/galactoside ABC-type transport system permease subunit